MTLNRRDVLRYGAAATLSTMAAAAVPALRSADAYGDAAIPADGTADFDAIVAAYRELQIGSSRLSPARTQALAALDQLATGFNATMNVASSQLWPDLPVQPGSQYFPMMYYRLRNMAVDWATPGSALSATADMSQRLLTALNTLYNVQYNENTAEIGNWYVYEIGVPYWLLQTIVALGSQLSPSDVQRYLRPVLRFVADPNTRTATPGLVETGANRADKSLIAVVSGALIGDSTRVANGLAAVTDAVGGGADSLVARVTSGDGYHTDGSFIQHGVVPYSGHYALVLLTAMAGLLRVTDGTALQMDPSVRQKFYDTVTDVYSPFLFAGSMMEPVRGRFLSRQGETGHDAGHQFIAAVVTLARTAPQPVKSQLSGLATTWINEGTWAPYLRVSDLTRFAGGLQAVGVPEIEYAEQMLAAQYPPTPSTAMHRAFPQMDRMVHVTSDWSASLGLSSTRIGRYEQINGENLHGWYVGDGALFTFLPNDQGHYSDAYWPTVDALLLPGTTEKDGAPPAFVINPPQTTTAFAGGVAFDSAHGAYGLDFRSQDGTLSAKKSWFFTPDAVLCLGAGITDSTGAHVRTTIENRNIGENGTAMLLIDGQPDQSTLGQVTVVPRASQLTLENVAGYALLNQAGDATAAGGTAAVTLLREDRTGTWLSIDTGANTRGTNDPYTRRYQKIFIDHGTNPSGATYAYAVLPNANDRQTREVPHHWRVLANTTSVQAIDLDQELTSAVFWAPGTTRGVTVSAPAAAMWGPGHGHWTFAISDSTQLQNTIRVTFADKPDGRVIVTDPAITVISTDPLTVDFNVTSSFGATHSFSIEQ